MSSHDDPISLIRQNANEILDRPDDYDTLLDDIGDCRFVLIGEATHGTHEFYRARARITQRLIEEKGFAAVAVEADWPDAYRVNRFVRGLGEDPDPFKALGDFTRFPRWMWRNTEVVEFIIFLRNFNLHKNQEDMAGFYGLDLYSLYTSIDKVIAYLDDVDPRAAQQARKRYSCFEQYGPEAESYGMAMTYVTDDCRREATAQLEELRRKGVDYVKQKGFAGKEELFYAQQNAKLAQDAEEYYRTMFSGRVSSWNMRDRHMADTLEALAEHIGSFREPKIVVWEHNSHLGDARATEVSRYGELNVGQLIRERYGEQVFNIGFTTHSGTVSAASSWGGDVERKQIRPSMVESYENLFHRSTIRSFYLTLKNNPHLSFLEREHLERAIGVIYMPSTERQSHYFRASLPGQFDAVIHFDQTNAVQPLEKNAGWEEGEPLPDTYRSGL
ncbi:MAG: erythromycin esterase family protein [Chitinispirillaceae bacterium]